MNRKARSPPARAGRARGTLARVALVVLCSLCAALAGTAVAVAAPPTPAGTFDGSATPAGSFGGVPWKVAVDEASGDVYVLDVGNDVVDRFTADGTYVSQIRGSDTTAGTFGFDASGLDDIAVDNSGGAGQGNLYVLSHGTTTIFAFDTSGAERYKVSGPGDTCGLAVDPDGFLWSADRQSNLSQLRPEDGAPTGTTIAMDGTERCHIAFDNEGAVYVAGYFEGFEKYDGVNPTVSLDPPPNTTYAVATSFRRNDVFSVAGHFSPPPPAPVIRQWNKSGGMVSEIRGVFGRNDFQGVAINGVTNKLYVADLAAGLVRMYDVAAQPPTVIIRAATNVGATATLNGTVNPNGSDVTDCHFEYGTLSSGRFASQAPCSPATPISGTSDVAVSADARGLTPNTQYQVRLVATNSGGPATSDPALFRTPLPRLPVVVTATAADITQTGATLNGTVNPQGSATSCVFQYGTTTSYGSEIATGDPGSGSSVVAVRAAVAGLTAGTDYHFRLVCRNAGGTSNGSDAAFRTLPPDVGNPCVANPALCQPPRCPADPTKCTALLRLSGNPVARVVGSIATVGVTCTGDQGGRCRGSLTFRAKVKVKVKRGRRTVVKRKTITVGTATYDFAVGSGGSLRITLTSAAKKARKLGAISARADGLDGAVKIPKAKARRKKRKR